MRTEYISSPTVKEEPYKMGRCDVCYYLWNDSRLKLVKCCHSCKALLCVSGHNVFDRAVAAVKRKLRGDSPTC